jgi:hypothetical protein
VRDVVRTSSSWRGLDLHIGDVGPA